MARSFEVHFCGESTTTECRVNYQMLAVAGNVAEVAQYGAPSWQLQTCSQPQPAAGLQPADNGIRSSFRGSSSN